MAMMYLYIVLIAVLLILLAFLTVPLRLEISCKNTKSDIKLTAFWGLIKLPLSAITKRAKKEKKGQNTQKDKEGEKLSQDKILKRLNDGLLLLKRIYKTYSKTRRFSQKRIVAEKVDVQISFSMFDAAVTGVTTGLVWSVLYQLLATLSLVALIDKHDFNVDPVYEEKLFFDIDIFCILKFSVVNIIGISLAALYQFRKSGIRKEE